MCAYVYEHCMRVCFLSHAWGVCVHMRDVGLHVCLELNLFGVVVADGYKDGGTKGNDAL